MQSRHQSDHPVCATKVASRHFLSGAATPPLEEGTTQHVFTSHHLGTFALCFHQCRERNFHTAKTSGLSKKSIGLLEESFFRARRTGERTSSPFPSPEATAHPSRKNEVTSGRSASTSSSATIASGAIWPRVWIRSIIPRPAPPELDPEFYGFTAARYGSAIHLRNHAQRRNHAPSRNSRAAAQHVLPVDRRAVHAHRRHRRPRMAAGADGRAPRTASSSAATSRCEF